MRRLPGLAVRLRYFPLFIHSLEMSRITNVEIIIKYPLFMWIRKYLSSWLLYFDLLPSRHDTRIIFGYREVIFDDRGRQIFVFHILAFFHYLKKRQYMNANICGTRDKYLLQRLSRVISETHDEKTNICLGIHKYLCFNNHSIRVIVKLIFY